MSNNQSRVVVAFDYSNMLLSLPFPPCLLTTPTYSTEDSSPAPLSVRLTGYSSRLMMTSVFLVMSSSVRLQGLSKTLLRDAMSSSVWTPLALGERMSSRRLTAYQVLDTRKGERRRRTLIGMAFIARCRKSLASSVRRGITSSPSRMLRLMI